MRIQVFQFLIWRLTIIGNFAKISSLGEQPERDCGRGSVGRMSPCQGEGRGFESHRPLCTQVASWPSGKARVCKTLITGSNPVDASKCKKNPEGNFYPSDFYFLVGNCLFSHLVHLMIAWVAHMTLQPAPSDLM
jgi:hypothetical protein